MAPVNIGICLNRERPHVARGLLGDPFQHRINQNSAGTTLAEAAAEFRRVKRRAGTRGGVARHVRSRTGTVLAHTFGGGLGRVASFVHC